MVNLMSEVNIISKNRNQFNNIIGQLNYKQNAEDNNLKKMVYVANNSPAFKPAANPEQPLNKRISLVYGFDNVRNLDSRDGVMKCSIEQLNQSLINFSGQKNYRTIKGIKNGIALSRRKVLNFNKLTGIDYATAKILLRSWRDFLRDNYDFISLKLQLIKKIEKCRTSCRNRECAQNLIIKNSSVRPHIDDGLRREIKVILEKFVQQGDVSGFKALSLRHNKNARLLTGIMKTMMLRRISKLGMEWSRHIKIMVNFDVDFSHQTAMKYPRGNVAQYWPLTYSAYRYCKRQKHDHVLIRKVPTPVCTPPILPGLR